MSSLLIKGFMWGSLAGFAAYIVARQILVHNLNVGGTGNASSDFFSVPIKGNKNGAGI